MRTIERAIQQQQPFAVRARRGLRRLANAGARSTNGTTASDDRFRERPEYYRARAFPSLAMGRDVEFEYLRLLVLSSPPNPDPSLECWRWPVRIYTLGPFEMATDAGVPRCGRKVQHKPLALAKALVALGGRDVRADRLIDILWDDTLEDGGLKAFEIAVHRLRKMLGSDRAVMVADRRVTLNPDIVWVDAWALEHALAPLIRAVNAPEPDVGLLEAAAPRVLSLYRGHFLAADAEEAWQIPIKNRLAGRFQRFALRLGEHWESKREWRRAFELYARAVELDPLAESFYRRQMICLQAQGERAEAIEVFRRCRRVLSVTLGVPPTSETEAVYRRLLTAPSAPSGFEPLSVSVTRSGGARWNHESAIRP